MTPRQLKVGSLPLPRCLLSRWELRSFCGIRGALNREERGYHERSAMQKKHAAGHSEVESLRVEMLKRTTGIALLSFSIPVKFQPTRPEISQPRSKGGF